MLIVSTGTMDEISGRRKCSKMSKYGNFTTTHCRAQPKTATPIPAVTKTDFSQDLKMHLTNKDKMGNIKTHRGKKQNMFKNTVSWLQKLANAANAQNLVVVVCVCIQCLFY